MPAAPRRSKAPFLILALVCLVPYFLTTVAFVAAVRFGGADILRAIKVAYNAYTLWLPPWCAAAGLAALFVSRTPGRRSARRPALLALGFAAVCFAARVYATHIEPSLLFVRHVTIRSPKVDRPIRVLHVTDIQTDHVGKRDRRNFKRMAELKPDLIIHTGDLLHPIPPATYPGELPKMAKLWASLHPPLGKYNVIGDADPPIIPQLLAGGPEVGGLRTLHAEDTVLTVGETRLRLLGLTVPQSRGGQGMQAQVAKWLGEGQGKHDFNILFGHAPDYVLYLEGQRKVDLCLAGHTHGGQIRIPFFGPLITFSGVPRDWARGYHKTSGFRLNVSAGLGAEHHAALPSIRVNCPPEMTLIEILPEKK